MPSQTTSARQPDSRVRLEILIGYTGFCAISLVGRFVPALIPLMVLTGLLLPLVWGWRHGDWEQMGFTSGRPGPALVWALLAGIVTSVIGFLTVKERSLAADLGRELAVGIPLWLLLASPFQEFFFRGWLQPRFERWLGRGTGLLASTAGFTAWHFCLPLAAGSGQSTFPLYSLPGLIATFGAGLVYGYGFQRSRSILTPWLAHAMSGIMFVMLGAASFVASVP